MIYLGEEEKRGSRVIKRPRVGQLAQDGVESGERPAHQRHRLDNIIVLFLGSHCPPFLAHCVGLVPVTQDKLLVHTRQVLVSIYNGSLVGLEQEVNNLNVERHYQKTIRGCSHMTSAKNGRVQTPPPPLVSQSQKLAYPPSPSCQPKSEFGLDW